MIEDRIEALTSLSNRFKPAHRDSPDQYYLLSSWEQAQSCFPIHCRGDHGSKPWYPSAFPIRSRASVTSQAKSKTVSRLSRSVS